ncbi:orotate phosphoribosyltransferase [Pseudohyphozyma bogoriensis]|nr:orotate phosphoribosyltransferase [Pseudohyphozyma bogoriensis]
MATSYAAQLIELSLSTPTPILRFGTFTLKSGRISPYFFNFGLFNTGALLLSLATAFADAIVAEYPAIGLADPAPGTPEVLFGPAYKGIPLVASVAAELARRGRDVGFAYNRKEAKAHGEGGSIVGAALDGKAVLIIDDVITKGTAIREAYKVVAQENGAVIGIASALDRQERGNGELSTVQEVERDLGMKVLSVVKMHDVIEWLRTQGRAGELEALEAYRKEYGV